MLACDHRPPSQLAEIVLVIMRQGDRESDKSLTQAKIADAIREATTSEYIATENGSIAEAMFDEMNDAMGLRVDGTVGVDSTLFFNESDLRHAAGALKEATDRFGQHPPHA